MDDQNLHDLLERLHEEIGKTGNINVDAEGRELLRHLNKDIQELLERTKGPPLRPQASLLTNLEKGIDHFEVTHPSLTTLLSDLLTALNNAGIQVIEPHPHLLHRS